IDAHALEYQLRHRNHRFVAAPINNFQVTETDYALGQRQHQVVGGLIAITGADIQLAFRHGKVDALRSKLGKWFQPQATECQLAFRHQWIETEVSIPEEMATIGAGNLEAIAVLVLAVTGGGKIEDLESQVVKGNFIRCGARLVTESEVALLQRQLTDGDAWNAACFFRLW